MKMSYSPFRKSRATQPKSAASSPKRSARQLAPVPLDVATTPPPSCRRERDPSPFLARRPTPLTTDRYLPRDAVNEISFTGCYEDSRDSVASSIDTSSLYSQRSREAVRRSRTTSDDVLKVQTAPSAAHGSHSRHASLSNEVLLSEDEVVYEQDEEYEHSYEEQHDDAGRAGPEAMAAAAFSPRAFHGSEAMGEDPGLNAEVVKLNVQQRKASAAKGRGMRATWRRRMGAAL